MGEAEGTAGNRDKTPITQPRIHTQAGSRPRNKMCLAWPCTAVCHTQPKGHCPPLPLLSCLIIHARNPGDLHSHLCLCVLCKQKGLDLYGWVEGVGEWACAWRGGRGVRA